MITRLNREALPRLSGSLQSVRFARKRTPEYPNYKAKLVPLSHKDKDHSGFFERHLKAWLGPKNIAGEYYMNKYYYVKQDNIPNYIVPDGKTLVSSNEPTNYRGVSGRDPHLHPFPHNPACKTASILTDDMKRAIFVDKTEKGLLAEELAQKYQLKLARIEAIVSLQKIKNTWEKENKITPGLAGFSSVMKKMFPIFSPAKDADNLTEIPMPFKTMQQRFLTISESEPFGAVDAATVYGLEPALETLDKLTDHREEKRKEVKLKKVVIGLQKEGDDTQFRFTHATAGLVGYRYGASRRDTKKDRSVGFDNSGKMVYTVAS